MWKTVKKCGENTKRNVSVNEEINLLFTLRDQHTHTHTRVGQFSQLASIRTAEMHGQGGARTASTFWRVHQRA